MIALERQHVKNEVKVGGTIWCEVRRYQANGPDKRLYAPYTVTRITDAKWVKARPQHGKDDEVVFTPTSYSSRYYERGGGRYPFVAEAGDDLQALKAEYEAYLAEKEAMHQAEQARKQAERQARLDAWEARNVAAIAANAGVQATEIPNSGGLFHATMTNHEGLTHHVIFKLEPATDYDLADYCEVSGYRVVATTHYTARHDDGRSSFRDLNGSHNFVRAAGILEGVALALQHLAKQIW